MYEKLARGMHRMDQSTSFCNAILQTTEMSMERVCIGWTKAHHFVMQFCKQQKCPWKRIHWKSSKRPGQCKISQSSPVRATQRSHAVLADFIVTHLRLTITCYTNTERRALMSHKPNEQVGKPLERGGPITVLQRGGGRSHVPPSALERREAGPHDLIDQ